jgi:hypothetical protein
MTIKYKSGLSLRAMVAIRFMEGVKIEENITYRNWIISDSIKNQLRQIPLYMFHRQPNCGLVTIKEIFEWLGREDALQVSQLRYVLIVEE